MEEKRYYYITMRVDGIEYFFHPNRKFYNAFLDGGPKIYQTKSGAVRMAKKITRVRTEPVSVRSVMVGESYREGRVEETLRAA